MATAPTMPTVQPSISKKTTTAKPVYPRTITFNGPKSAKKSAKKLGKRTIAK